MNFFLYILPNQFAADKLAAAIADAGLSHLPAPSTLITRSLYDGPDGRPCTILADGRCPASELNWRPAEQCWTPSVNGKFHIGYWTGRLPAEPDLRRGDLIDGHAADLGDRGTWHVPCARKFPVGTCLPEKIRITAAGAVLEARPEFAAFSFRAERLFRQLMRSLGLRDVSDDAADQPLSGTEECLIVCEALRLNYVVGVDEVNLLGLLDTRTLSTIANCIVDMPAVQEALVKRLAELKKNNALLGATSNAPAGSDGPEPTGRLSASTSTESEAEC